MGIIRIAQADLTGLDDLAVDSIALPMFQVRTQPRSVAGYVDWRLSGRIARMVKAGRFAGRPHEALMTTSLGRFGAERIFLLGLGEPQTPNQLAPLLRQQATMLFEAGARVLAVAPPSPVVPDAPSPAFLIRWLEAMAATAARFEEVVLLDPGDELLMSQDTLHSASNKAGMTWGG